jgi:glycerol-1-phosphate dehydrogenase [NAD(P)+]
MSIPVYIGNDAVSHLLQYCKDQNLEKFLLVSDENTQAVLGDAVQKALLQQDYDVVLAMLSGEEVIADEKYLMQVFIKAGWEDRVYISVGSGTLTDITRFVSHRNKSPFIAMPTAPSVDGFNSTGAPLVVGGLKQTIPCQGPIALFADLPILKDAPPLLIASGFADLVGKLLSAADWKLGHVLWDEPYDADIEQRSRKAALECAEAALEVGLGTEEAIRLLMNGLIESGFCMLDFGSSSPASGAEHHLSHYWEMMLLRQGRPSVFHGLKVGIASVITAGWYERLRTMARSDAEKMLQGAQLPDSDDQIKLINAAFGPVSKQLIDEQADFLFMEGARFEKLKTRILKCWDEVVAIAEASPTASQMAEWLRLAGGAVYGRDIGLNDDEVEQAKAYGHFIRSRFTINKLRLLLGIE